jgi:very-short-patch-repair endonuclease
MLKHNKCGHICNQAAKNILNGINCCICYGGIKLSQEQFEERFYDEFGNDYEVIGNYLNNRTPVEIKHNCGCEFTIIPSNAFGRKQCNCPVCYSKMNHHCIPYVNDIYATNKKLYNLLKDKKDGHKYKELSHEKTYFICPDCGEEIYAPIYYVANYGLSCSKCGTGISFPERLMSSILSQLNIEYNFQFSPDWIKPYKYDFQIVINDKYYIIEMDGGWHYFDNNLSGMTLKETKARDKFKTIEAEKHGYVMIRIDCNYNFDNREEYIKKNIVNSELSKIIDIENVDWDNCLLEANTPLIKRICNEWNNGVKSIVELQDKLKLSDTTIRRYLYMASKNHVINESIEDIKQLNFQHMLKTYNHPRNTLVMCNETGEIFHNFKEAQNKYHGNISNYFRDENRKFAGTLSDGTRLTWTRLEKVI